MCNHGLSNKQIDTIKKILSEHCPGVERVSLFGSRAMGNYKNYSDIDLVLYGDIDESEANRLWTVFHESNLPYKVDIQVFDLIRHALIRRHIEEKEKTLFTKGDL